MIAGHQCNNSQVSSLFWVWVCVLCKPNTSQDNVQQPLGLATSDVATMLTQHLIIKITAISIRTRFSSRNNKGAHREQIKCKWLSTLEHYDLLPNKINVIFPVTRKGSACRGSEADNLQIIIKTWPSLFTLNVTQLEKYITPQKCIHEDTR